MISLKAVPKTQGARRKKGRSLDSRTDQEFCFVQLKEEKREAVVQS